MASPSSSEEPQNPPQEQQQQPPKEKEKECLYKTKPIQFLGRSTPIVLQNDNGPCPLLAICNNLSLSLSIFRMLGFYFLIAIFFCCGDIFGCFMWKYSDGRSCWFGFHFGELGNCVAGWLLLDWLHLELEIWSWIYILLRFYLCFPDRGMFECCNQSVCSNAEPLCGLCFSQWWSNL